MKTRTEVFYFSSDDDIEYQLNDFLNNDSIEFRGVTSNTRDKDEKIIVILFYSEWDNK